jgi:hypothetical protein
MPALYSLVASVIVIGLFMAYGLAARQGRLSGFAVPLVGTAIGGLAVALSVAVIAPHGAPKPLLAANALMMALATAFCVAIATRQARVEELAAREIDGVSVRVLACSAWRLPAVDAVIVPASTTLSTLAGPAGPLRIAAGGALDAELRGKTPLPLDKVLATGAGRLSAGRVLHVAVHETGRPVDAGRLRRGIEAGLQQARKGGAASVVVAIAPLPGLSATDLARATIEAVIKQRRGLKQIVVVPLQGRGERELAVALGEATV